jgi:hypothetical protein
MEYGIEYINPSFYDMHKYYIAPCDLNKGSKGKFYKIYKLKLLITLITRIVRKLELEKYIKRIKLFNSTNEENINLLLSLLPSRDIYVGGWYFRVNNLAEKYQDYFIGKYTLKDKYIKNNNVMNLIDDMKRKGTLVVGVHIRRGDYKHWQGGKYNFDDDVYKNYMHALGIEIERSYNKNVCFIIFSNEDISINENKYIYKSNNKWYVDHFLMSKCDMLIGPPSTFTMWASYIGKVKYCHIGNNSGKISLDDFTYCRGEV